MYKIVKIWVFSVIFPVVVMALNDKELAISIDLSGKQRMLTQKMTKESFLIRSNIDKKENIEKLIKSSQLFDKTLKGLMLGDRSLNLVAIKNEAIQNQLKKVQELWVPFYQEIQSVQSGKASDSSYDMLEKNNITLLQEMNQAVGLYAAENKGDSKLTLANDINLAGKQRMLTQKMAKALLFISNDFKKEMYTEDFKTSRKLFTTTLEGLFKGSKALNLTGTQLPKITTQLKVVETLWKEHQSLLDNALKNKGIKEAISGLDTILVEMNKGVILYTQSINRQKQQLQLASIIGDFMNKSGIM
ncbi:type IV pili methyl-accepting chemotaxis transducer N-terminal domain-containing protein [bacterium]|nr:type IV pili methyl-accepting chemotaxis transducer N-terminal domain-containing protein [bacterium]MBU1959506.1 type IV pili methyl-accepting chemotaxis transducer N-terminal domain-containing protein [bacterium]